MIQYSVLPIPSRTPARGRLAHLRRCIVNAIQADALNAKARAKIVLRILYKPLQVLRIERVLDANGLARISRRNVRIYEKPTRPYLASGLSTTEKVDLITSHYLSLLRHFSGSSIEAMYLCKLVVAIPSLAALGAEVDLRYDRHMEKEGELTLWLSLDGATLFSATFVLHPRALYIGSMQGGKAPQEELRRFTKLTHGVRPHNFVIFLIRMIAGLYGLPTLMAVNNQSHVYQAKKHTQDRIRFDYDAFWLENGGKPDAARFFTLPAQWPRKDLAEVAANKRALYRRRYEFLDACAREFAEALKALA